MTRWTARLASAARPAWRTLWHGGGSDGGDSGDSGDGADGDGGRGGGRLDRAVEGVDARLPAVRGRPPATLALRVVRRSVQVGVPGLAAQMAFYLALSVVPLLSVLGAGLGLLGGVLGPQATSGAEDLVASAVAGLLPEAAAQDVAAGLVEAVLRDRAGGATVGSVLVAVYLGSRVFRAAVRTLGRAYRIPEPRGLLRVQALALLFTASAVLVGVVVLALLVVGPLLGVGQRLADSSGAGGAYATAWAVGRWPVVLVIVAAFLAWLYAVGETADNTWRDVLPGALVAAGALALLLVGFRSYLQLTGTGSPADGAGDAAVRLVGAFLSASLSGLLLAWLASTVVLVGGVLNAEWESLRPTGGPGPRPRRRPAA